MVGPRPGPAASISGYASYSFGTALCAVFAAERARAAGLYLAGRGPAWRMEETGA